jgi:hypothetical protein
MPVLRHRKQQPERPTYVDPYFRIRSRFVDCHGVRGGVVSTHAAGHARGTGALGTALPLVAYYAAL